VDPAVVGAVVVQSVETVTGPNSLTVPGQDGGSVEGQRLASQTEEQEGQMMEPW
jgi:hypothetical protein